MFAVENDGSNVVRSLQIVGPTNAYLGSHSRYIFQALAQQPALLLVHVAGPRMIGLAGDEQDSLNGVRGFSGRYLFCAKAEADEHGKQPANQAGG